MVKSVLGVNHQGLRDWIVQRLSALFLAGYSFWLIFYLLLHPDLSYGEWHALFSLYSVKIATLLFIGCLLWHAWLGMWTVFTDYVKPFILRCLLHTLVIYLLLACFLWGVMILWSV